MPAAMGKSVSVDDLVRLRLAHYLSGADQSAVAAAAGIRQQQVSDYKRGEWKRPPLDVLDRMARAFGLSLAALHTPLEALRVTRDALIDELTDTPSARRAGTLAADVVACLATLRPGPHKRDTETLLAHWTAAEATLPTGERVPFGELPRAAVTPLHVRTALATFGARFAPKTVRELRRVLAWIWSTLDGPDARNPVRAVPAPRVRYDDPRGIDYAIIRRILEALPDRGRPEKGQRRPAVNLTKIRLAVMAFTGMHQAEVGRLEPPHLDLARSRVWIAPRKKGAGSPGAWHELTAPAVDALRAFAEADAFGPFSARSMAHAWRRACRTAAARWTAEHPGEPWPLRDDARPYDLRHSFGTAVYLATGDIRAAQAMLRHRQTSTTDRYTRAGVAPQVRRAVAALDVALAVPTDSAKPGAGSVTKRPPTSRRQHATTAAGQRRKPRENA